MPEPTPIATDPALRRRPGQLALSRLLHLAAHSNTGQAHRIADFLLAWHNAGENGGWNPVDMWGVDDAIADDMLTVLQFLRQCHCYPSDLGFGKEMEALWQQWRTTRSADSSNNSISTQE